MRNLNELKLRRIPHPVSGDMGDEGCGAFVSTIDNRDYLVIASAYYGWDHVSVSPVRGNRCPSWDVMCAVKDLFFDDDEVAMQLHPKKRDYVNRCECCLHLWRPHDVEIPLPPKVFV